MNNVGKTNRIHDHLSTFRIIRISFFSPPLLPRRKAINQTMCTKRSLWKGVRLDPGGNLERDAISLFFPNNSYSHDFTYPSADLFSRMLLLDCMYLYVCEREGGKPSLGRANGENIRPIFRDRGDLCTPTTIWGRLSIRVYQILSPTKLCIWSRHSSRLWNEFTSSLLEKEIVSYRSSPHSLPSFLPSFVSRKLFSRDVSC